MNNLPQSSSKDATPGEKRRRKAPRLSTLQCAYRAYLWKGVGLAIIAGLVVLLAIRLQPERYAAQSRLIVESGSNNGSKSLHSVSLDSSFPHLATHAAHIESSAFLNEFWSGLSELAKEKTLKPYPKLDDTPENGVLVLRDSISAYQVNDSQLIEIQVSHPLSYVSKYLADELAADYADYTQNQLVARTEEAREDLENLAFQRRQNVLDAEKDLQDFRRNSGLALTENGENLMSDRFSQTNSALLAAKIEALQLKRTVERLSTAQTQGMEALLAIEPIKSNPVVLQLNKEAENLRTKLKELSATYQRRHPTLVETIEEIAENRQQLERTTNSIVDTTRYNYELAQEVQDGLMSEIESLESKALSNAGDRAQYDVLRSKLQAQRAAYDETLNQLTSSQASTQNPPKYVRVIDTAALPSKPHFPSFALLVALPSSAGLLTFLTAPLLMVLITKRFRIWDDIEAILGTRVLGTLPQIRNAAGAARYNRFLQRRKRQLPTLDIQNVADNQARESLTGLASQLMVGPFSRGSRVLLVTSHGENEGKSTTVYNLAKEFAKAGKRTIVIDCDLRRDVLSKTFEKSGEVDTAKGLNLADWFNTSSKSGAFAHLAICKSNTLDGLDFVPGGDATDNTSKLILSKIFQQLISKLKLQYDIVILDTPPAGAYSDALLLTTVSDEVLFLIREGVADKVGIKKTLHSLRTGHAHIAGVALNGLTRRQIQMIGTYYERNIEKTSSSARTHAA